MTTHSGSGQPRRGVSIEVFPTDVRARGVGIGSAFSSIGAAAGTFLLPVGLSTIGVGASMVIGAALCVVGALVSQRLAPETTGHTLTRTSAIAGRYPSGAAAGRA
jgi:MFS transporter, putative metabolite transport protein